MTESFPLKNSAEVRCGIAKRKIEKAEPKEEI